MGGVDKFQILHGWWKVGKMILLVDLSGVLGEGLAGKDRNDESIPSFEGP